MPHDPSPLPWASYALDAWQRSVIFLDVLRERGNAFLEREADPMLIVEAEAEPAAKAPHLRAVGPEPAERPATSGAGGPAARRSRPGRKRSG